MLPCRCWSHTFLLQELELNHICENWKWFMPPPTHHAVDCHTAGRARPTNSKHLSPSSEGWTFQCYSSLVKGCGGVIAGARTGRYSQFADYFHSTSDVTMNYKRKQFLRSTPAVPRVLLHHRVQESLSLTVLSLTEMKVLLSKCCNTWRA